MTATESALANLARLYGVQSSYLDVGGQRCVASPEALLAVLQALGAPAANLAEVPDALRQTRLGLWRRGLPPVAVSWEGRPTLVRVRLPATGTPSTLDCTLRLEDGNVQHWHVQWEELPFTRETTVAGERFQVRVLTLPEQLPWGYHKLTLEAGGQSWTATVIAAPEKAYSLPEGKKEWGAFVPVYALHTAQGWGAGSYSDLRSLVEWLGERGGTVVATLPLMASFLEVPFEPSPYAPSSRLFWNEFYVDVTQLPEWADCPAAQALTQTPQWQEQLQAARASRLVDYQGVMRLKRQVLHELAQVFFARPSPRLEQLRNHVREHPTLEDFACFEATCLKQQGSWYVWPERLRDGDLQPGDYDEEVKQAYLYAQWAAREQMQAVARTAQRYQAGLYLDMPLGVHSDGYDPWRFRHLFLGKVSAGAPPDGGFTRGQDWGFQPLHPGRIREDGYQYVSAYLRHHFTHANILRIDHVMGLHRLFCIPHGLPPKDGVYVRYPAEELYAVICLESQRHRCTIVGEDLGTVPFYVGPAMLKHNLRQMYVLEYEIEGLPHGNDLRQPPRGTVASVNTHDMPPLAAYWMGEDITYRRDLGLIGSEYADNEYRRRDVVRQRLLEILRHAGCMPHDADDLRSLLRACLTYLARSPAEVVLVNLEDLWLETKPQNVPGTHREHPNWQLKTRLDSETMVSDPQVLDMLRLMNEIRTQTEGTHET
ncbi:MAG: 4-alpha-glucanotransferase [Gemmataceae bacterium]